MLSKFQLNRKEKLNISDDHVEKLICDLPDKKHYMVHYKKLTIIFTTRYEIKMCS